MVGLHVTPTQGSMEMRADPEGTDEQSWGPGRGLEVTVGRGMELWLSHGGDAASFACCRMTGSTRLALAKASEALGEERAGRVAGGFPLVPGTSRLDSAHSWESVLF